MCQSCKPRSQQVYLDAGQYAGENAIDVRRPSLVVLAGEGGEAGAGEGTMLEGEEVGEAGARAFKQLPRDHKACTRHPSSIAARVLC